MKLIFEGGDGSRLDVFLTAALTDVSRSRAARLIKEGAVTVNGNKVKAGYALVSGDVIEGDITAKEEISVAAEEIPLDIYYEDHDLLVVNKPRGMVVHPAPGSGEHTLVNALMAHCGDLSGINGVLRPGIVHRIDKDTSGLLLVAKNDMAHRSLAAQFKEHSIRRLYEGIVCGMVAEPEGIVDCPIGRHPSERKKMAVTEKNSKNALTRYRVLERFPGYTLIEAKLATGRTHQIRVHMKYIGYPLLGDPLYGKGEKNPFFFKGQALHAKTIGFVHPRTGETLEFTAPLPPDMTAVLEKLRKEP